MNPGIRLMIGAAVLGIMLGVGYWGALTIYDAGKTAGRAEIQTKWDADKQANEQKVAEIEAENAEKLRELDNANQETVDEYEQKLAVVADSVNTYANRLHAVEAELSAARNRPDPAPAANQPSAPPPPITVGPGQLEQAIGARLAECDVNEAQLSALIAELKPQVPAEPDAAPP